MLVQLGLVLLHLYTMSGLAEIIMRSDGMEGFHMLSTLGDQNIEFLLIRVRFIHESILFSTLSCLQLNMICYIYWARIKDVKYYGEGLSQ